NQMGFNNAGAAVLAENLAAAAPRTAVPVGVNIGKNRDTPMDAALDDYMQCLRVLYPFASYVVVNVSSPNTPGLRDLQRGRVLDELLSALLSERDRLASVRGEPARPLLVKVAPDMDGADLYEVIDVCL